MSRFLSLLAVLAPVVALHVYRPTHVGEWTRLALEWMHVFVFVVVAIGVWLALPTRLAGRKRSAATILASLILAVASEAAQIPTPRNASWSDIIADATGAVIGLLLVLAARRSPRLLNSAGVTAFVLLVISAYPVLDITWTYVNRNLTFPVIFNGIGPTNTALLSVRGARAEFIPQSRNTRPYLEVIAGSASRPAIDFRNMVRNWSDFRSLVVDVEVDGTVALNLTIRVHDGLHRRGNQAHADRFNRTFELSPGRHTLRILLDEIQYAPTERSMEMSDIDGLVIFANKVESESRLRLYEIRLD